MKLAAATAAITAINAGRSPSSRSWRMSKVDTPTRIDPNSLPPSSIGFRISKIFPPAVYTARTSAAGPCPSSAFTSSYDGIVWPARLESLCAMALPCVSTIAAYVSCFA